MSEMLAVRDNWLDTTLTSAASAYNTTGGSSTTVTTTGPISWGDTSYYPWYYGPYYYPVYTSSPARPIRLTLSEVERLRKAAKADDKLKSILQKFTLQIEITVDFE